MNWQNLHNHYTMIKNKHHLISADILRQLGEYPTCAYIGYLNPSGYDRHPSNKIGTVGRTLRDILIKGLTKTDWTPSTATYSEKLYDRGYNHMYMTIRVINNSNINPELEITLCMDEGPMLTKDILADMFTIDNIKPTIVNVYKSYQLVYRDYTYIPIGDQVTN